jgi:hypothetical protein
MPSTKAKSEKNQSKISFFTMSEKENPWSEDETDTGTTTEANEPIEVDDDALLTEVERSDLSLGAMMGFWWSALAACL